MIAMLLFLSTALGTEVVCTLPWLGDLTERLAPDAHITVLATGTQDPHYLSPTPALMAKVGRADLYVENGMGLELWSERLLDGAGNPSIRPGKPGYVRASDGAPRLGIPTVLSRSQGDLHPDGNPHIWMDPLNATTAADHIAAGLSRVDPVNAEAYAKRAAAFRAQVHERLFGADLVAFMGGDLLERLARGDKLIGFLESKGLLDRLGGWLAHRPAATDPPVVLHHDSWVYFAKRFDLRIVGFIENRPGIAPSAAHRAELQEAIASEGVTTIGITSYYDPRLARALAERTGATVVRLPGDVGGLPQATDYFAMMDLVVASLGRKP